MLSCNFTTPQNFDPPAVLQKLYGPYFDKMLSGRGSLLVLGQHNSGTSMLARLLMLMGAFQGNAHGLSLYHLLDQGQYEHSTCRSWKALYREHTGQRCLAGLSTSPTNRLKYWEIIDVTHFHDIVLSWVTDNKFRPYHAQGVNKALLSKDRKETISCFARKTVHDLNRHRPWVLKDPRMLLFAQHWIRHVCATSVA